MSDHQYEQWAEKTVVQNCIIIIIIIITIDRDRRCPRFVADVIARSDKTAELSQRRPRDAPNIWVPEKFWESSLRTRLLFHKFVMDFCSDRY